METEKELQRKKELLEGIKKLQDELTETKPILDRLQEERNAENKKPILDKIKELEDRLDKANAKKAEVIMGGSVMLFFAGAIAVFLFYLFIETL